MSLERIEGRLQALIEDNLTRLLDGRLQPQTLARKLARALEEGIHKEVDGLSAPDLYTVVLNPDDMEDLTARYHDVASRLAEQLATLAADWHLSMNQSPRVVLISDIRLDPFEVDIKADRTPPSFEKTQQMEAAVISPTPQREATLVLAGGRQIQLDRPVINIGRRTDNHIMVDDKRVSRQHCQIRLRFGRFVIYDLESKGGTQVNGLQIKEHILQAGDVISLAGYQMVYTEDRSTSEIDLGVFSDTQSFETPNDESPDGDNTL
ncbi:MAG: hypothetical protein BroJett018_19050 [Chloroflexota bacterium]|nr:MAG: hypothetical protein BroJett018_19050 [Chloroflexota bacterium]